MILDNFVLTIIMDPKPKCWSKSSEAAKFLLKLFTTKQADPSKQAPKYIKTLFEKHQIFHPYSQKRFYTHYRNLAADYTTNITKVGARKKGLYLFIWFLIYQNNY